MTKLRGTPRLLTGIAVAATALVIAVTAIGVAIESPSQRASSRPGPSASSTPTAVPTPEPSVIPPSCAGVYTRDWATELAPFVLNPDWAKQDPSIGTNDPTLTKLLKPVVRLTCQWGKSSGGGDTGIVTSLASIDESTTATVKSRFNELGWTCFDVSGGVRCVIEQRDDNGSWGESHFLRDGVWVATRWSNLAPDGYTADIIASLFP